MERRNEMLHPKRVPRKVKGFAGCYTRLHILTVAKTQEGKKFQFPDHRVGTFAKAERGRRLKQGELSKPK